MASELAALKSALTANDLSKASSLLSALKVKLTTFASLPPLYEPSAHAADELALAREVLEQAVLLSVAQRDAAAFERHFAQLKPYYADARCVGRAAGRKRREGVPPAVPSPPRALTSPPPRSPLLPPSPAEHRLVGLNLLRLLVQNRTSEFHCELELLSAESLGSAHVHHAVALEQSLMEGAYNKVLAGTSAPPDGSYAWFTEALAATVREEVAACAAASYDRLPLRAAAQLLRLDVAATAAFCAKQGWVVGADGCVDFAAANHKGEAAIPAPQLIAQVLAYSRELERII